MTSNNARTQSEPEKPIAQYTRDEAWNLLEHLLDCANQRDVLPDHPDKIGLEVLNRIYNLGLPNNSQETPVLQACYALCAIIEPQDTLAFLLRTRTWAISDRLSYIYSILATNVPVLMAAQLRDILQGSIPEDDRTEIVSRIAERAPAELMPHLSECLALLPDNERTPVVTVVAQRTPDRFASYLSRDAFILWQLPKNDRAGVILGLPASERARLKPSLDNILACMPESVCEDVRRKIQRVRTHPDKPVVTGAPPLRAPAELGQYPKMCF